MAKYKLTPFEYIINQETQAYIPVAEDNRDYQEYQVWLSEGNTPDPSDPAYNETWEYVREQRNILLYQCDWTQLVDSPLTSEKKTEWADYRQELRDLPETFSGVPASGVIWPSQPE